MVAQQGADRLLQRTGAVASDDPDRHAPACLLTQQKGIGLGDSLRHPQSMQVELGLGPLPVSQTQR
jgi:hypothetical protein